MAMGHIFADAIFVLRTRQAYYHQASRAFKVMERAIKVLEEGQGYLTREEPVKVVFYKDM